MAVWLRETKRNLHVWGQLVHVIAFTYVCSD